MLREVNPMETLTSDMLTVPSNMKVYQSKLLDTQPSVDPGQLPLFDVQPDGTFVLPEAS